MGKQITKKVGLINEALAQIGKSNEEVAARDEQAVQASDERIRAVLARFERNTAALTASAEQSRTQSAVIKEEICESLVQLQFQDRVSQILAQVSASMDDLSTQAGHSGSTEESERLAKEHAERMVSTYTTEEQRLNHQGIETTAVEQSAVTFF